jgi:hypothetical protein
MRTESPYVLCLQRFHQIGGICHVLLFYTKIYALRILLIFTREFAKCRLECSEKKLDMFLEHRKVDSIRILYLINIILTEIKIDYICFSVYWKY